MHIVFDGNSYVLHPAFEALSAIETELGTGVIALVRKLSDGDMTLADLSVILAHCLQPQLDASFIKEALLRNGLIQAVEAVSAMFSVILGGAATLSSHVELEALAHRFPD